MNNIQISTNLSLPELLIRSVGVLLIALLSNLTCKFIVLCPGLSVCLVAVLTDLMNGIINEVYRLQIVGKWRGLDTNTLTEVLKWQFWEKKSFRYLLIMIGVQIGFDIGPRITDRIYHGGESLSAAIVSFSTSMILGGLLSVLFRDIYDFISPKFKISDHQKHFGRAEGFVYSFLNPENKDSYLFIKQRILRKQAAKKDVEKLLRQQLALFVWAEIKFNVKRLFSLESKLID
jgi:hypothetical protein